MSDSTARVWFVTGCSSGLGHAIARAALRRGELVVATARDAAALEPLVAAAPGRAIALPLDVTDDAQIAAAVAAATERFGRIDVLVNNAGRVQIGAVEELSDGELRALYDLHVFGPTALVRAVLPGMRARGAGTIVQMSTMGAFFIKPGFGAYTSTKAALEGLSATLAQEVAPFGVRVLIVEPGAHRTPVFAPERAARATELDVYADTVGVTRAFIERENGSQGGDPERAAEIVVDVVLGDDLPLRLPLGADAVQRITEATGAIAAEVGAWAGVAASTAYGAEPGTRPA